MSKMNLVIDLRGYDGNSSSNTCNPSFSKNAQYIGVDITEETVQEVAVAASATVSLFSVAPADAKKIIYLEATDECDITVNGVAESTIKPIVIGSTVKRGVFLKSSSIESVSVTNNGTADISVYYITSK